MEKEDFVYERELLSVQEYLKKRKRINEQKLSVKKKPKEIGLQVKNYTSSSEEEESSLLEYL